MAGEHLPRVSSLSWAQKAQQFVFWAKKTIKHWSPTISFLCSLGCMAFIIQLYSGFFFFFFEHFILNRNSTMNGCLFHLRENSCVDCGHLSSTKQFRNRLNTLSSTFWCTVHPQIDSLYQKKTKKCNIIAIIFQHLKNFKDILDLLSPVLDLWFISLLTWLVL